MYTLPKIERFNQNVLSKYHISNSVFITLPFDAIDNTGVLLPLFSEVCDAGFKSNWSPKQIVDFFADKYLDNATEEKKIDLMFRFIQYVERQIVLFDAIEDAAFPIVNNLEGRGSLRDIKEQSDDKDKREELIKFLESFNVRTVLTAHPTQFYPGSVLGIITDLTEAIRQSDLLKIKQLLAQLGKAPFIKKEKPTPYDEAVSLIWYLENVFYQTIGDMMQYLQKNVFDGNIIENPIINLGFWPGGDRDGNPFVTPEITEMVASRLRTSILKCYYFDVRALRRKLTFNEVDAMIFSLENKLYRSVFYSQGEVFISLEELKNELNKIKQIIINEHNSLYLDDVNLLLQKVNQFGYHFASLDIRQNSKIHNEVFDEIIGFLKREKAAHFPQEFDSFSEDQRMEVISKLKFDLSNHTFENELTRSTLDTIKLMREIQKTNGEKGSNRYIISNNESALNVIETFAMFRLIDWENPSVDIVPLFESVDDLQHAHHIMEQLYKNEIYRKHIAERREKQTVMLGF